MLKKIFSKNIMKKKEKIKDNINEEALNTPAEKTEGDVNPEEKKSVCENEIEAYQQTVKELNEKYLRIYSEFDNYRKRTLKEKNELVSYASSQLIIDLLPVLDDFERALSNIAVNETNAPIIEGLELIHHKLFNTLEKQGLKPINAKGADFNTDYHEAITKMAVEEEEMKGKVYDEVQKGYMLHEKVIRFSKVVVGE